MSSFAGYCGWCQKPVMHKTFFGTLHICLTDEEKSVVLMNKQQMMKQQMPTPKLAELLKKYPNIGKAFREQEEQE